MSNLFNERFVSIADNIIEHNNGVDPDFNTLKEFIRCHKPENSPDFSILILTKTEVMDPINSLPSGVATGLDYINSKLLKLIAPAIAPSLAKVLNCSIKNGICPAQLKLPRVKPIYKQGKKADVDNYRPISVLPVLSKILEKHICHHFMAYLNAHCLLYKQQSGFRPQHSCETILLKLTDEWLEAMDNGLFTGVVMVDLRKAFDLVNHELLLKKLELYGLYLNKLNLFNSYLNGRYQKVCIYGKLSEPLKIHSGVPQGSILGSALFLLFINDLPLGLKNNIGLFADDSTPHASGPTLQKFEEKIKTDLHEISKWTEENKKKIHQSKTKYGIISTRQKLLKSPVKSLDLTLDGNCISKTES